MKLTAEEKQNLGVACERHRLYLLAKNDYNRCGAISAQIQGNDIYISYSDGKAKLWRIGVGYLKTC